MSLCSLYYFTYANVPLQSVARLAQTQIRARFVDAGAIYARRVNTLVHICKVGERGENAIYIKLLYNNNTGFYI